MESNREEAALYFDYHHGRLRSLGRWLYYVAVLLATFLSAVLLAIQYGTSLASIGSIALLFGTVFAASFALASWMMMNVLKTRAVSIERDHLTMPHFGSPHVPLGSITAVHADRPTKGTVLIGIEGQIPRQLNVTALRPAITTSEFSALLTAQLRTAISTERADHIRSADLLAKRALAFPYVTLLMAGSLVAIHFFAWSVGSRFDALDVLASGASFTPIPITQDPLRIVDSLVLHANWKHVMSNFLMFFLLGTALERIVGWRVLLTFFVVGGSFAIAASVALSGEGLRVGASGGICALLGLHLYLLLAKPFPLPATIAGLPNWLVVPIALVSMGIALPGVDWIAHSAGLVFGLVAARALLPVQHATEGAQQDWQAARPRLPWPIVACSLLLLVAALADVSRRTIHLANGGRAATLQQVIESSAPAHIVSELLWIGVVEPHENLEVASAGIERLHDDPANAFRDHSVLASLYFLRGNFQRAYAAQKVALLEARAESDELKSRYAARLVYFATSAVQPFPNVGSTDARCVEVTVVVGALAEPDAVMIAMQPNNEQPAFERELRRTVLSSEPGKPCNTKPLHIRIARSDWQRTQGLFRRDNAGRPSH